MCSSLVLGLALVVTACRWLPITEEREAVASYIWHKRGTEAGELMRVYCLGGSTRERRWMAEALQHHAAPAKVTIVCPD